MEDGTMHRAAIDPDAEDLGDGVALAVVRDGKAVKIGHLPQDHAKLMVDRGLLPARVYEEIGFFWNDAPYDDFPGSAVGDESEIENPWKELAAMLDEGDESVHAGLCSDREFLYWVKL